MRRALLALTVAWPMAVSAQADPATLADIREQIGALTELIAPLRAELTASGSATGVSGNTALERLDAIEASLQRLTSKAEELESRINRVVTDGTNRIGDLEFRLCELEEGCDIGSLGDTAALGGVDNAAAVPAPAPDNGGGPALAVNEQADYDAGAAALAAGDFRGAADRFSAFVAAYPGSPLTGQAQLGRGQALDGAGDTAGAARAYLDAFSSDPAGTAAPAALVGLGRSLGRLGQGADACVTLAEVATRFPASPQVLEAEAERRALGCP